MANYTRSFDVYSPRWGHTDKYNLIFSNGGIEITQSPFSAKCSFPDGEDPVWTGYNEITGNPLMKIFINDSIYVSDIVVDALENAWRIWKEDTTTDSDLNKGLDELFEWISKTSQAKPHSKLWQGIF